MVKKNDYFKIKDGKIFVKAQTVERGAGRMKAALEQLENAKNDLEYALKYAGYAWLRGSIGEQRNMISLAGVAKENAERAAERIKIAVQMVNGNLGSLIPAARGTGKNQAVLNEIKRMAGRRGCGKTPPEFIGPTSFNIDDPEYQEEKK